MKSSQLFVRRVTRWCASAVLAASVSAAPPVVKTVPWVATNPLIPHTTYPSRSVRLKGTSDQYGANIKWTWDFGDGSAVATGTVATSTAAYGIEAQHTYTGALNTIYTARLTVWNDTTGETASKPYYIQMLAKTLDAEVNVAIDEGLWYLHKYLNRSSSGGIDYGWWNSGYAGSGYYGVTAVNINAFEVNGYLESGSPDNPYTETVRRGLNKLFTWLTSSAINMQSLGNPDTNGNGKGVFVNQSYPFYQGGMFMDAIVASGTPNAVTDTGGADILGRTYRDIVQDMVDAHAWAQYDDIRYGGWRYSPNEFPDNSVCQWAAIGLLAAERGFGCTIPPFVKTANINWLSYSQNPSTGVFGYTSSTPAWGPFAVTPSGMVQMVFDGIGRGSTLASPSWEKAESFMRENFTTTATGYGNSVKDYYYGMFSFVKSLLLHQSGGGRIVFLHSLIAGHPDIDWYAAQTSMGDPTDGVARTLVNDQNANGYWYGHDADGNQYYFETAWAVIMLQRTVFESGVPVAVAKAVPNPAVAGQTILLDGSDSYHQDAAKSIVQWAWDLNDSGVFVPGGPTILTAFPSVGAYTVKLRVTDNVSVKADTTLIVLVSTPPLAPTADANGPYHFCTSTGKWYLDGRNSLNPDEGGHQPGTFPGDTIKLYAWDLDGDNDFDDAFGATPDVKPFFAAHGMGVGSYLISLRVTDTTATSYPASGLGDLSNTASASVYVEDVCACVTLMADPVIKGVMLSWNAHSSADVKSYHVFRGNTSGGPYTMVADVTTLAYEDHAPGPLNQTYYYVVRPALLNGDEVCQSNEASAEPLHPVPTAFCVLNPVSNAPYYYKVDATSLSFGHMQLQMYVGDTASGLVVGPLPAASLIYLRTHYSVATTRAGIGSVAAFITVKGGARVWAQDPLGQKSPEIIVP